MELQNLEKAQALTLKSYILCLNIPIFEDFLDDTF